MDSVIKKLQHEIMVLKLFCLFLSLTLLSLVFLAFTFQRTGDEIIRTRGIIVVDENGNDRILLGAPVPNSAHRIRSSVEKAKTAWGKRFPSFDWYKNLNNSSNGMIILDEHGYDKITIGDPVPDPNIGKRIAPSVGIAINDTEGFERSGWGFAPENNRVVFGLDSPQGSEGVILSILEDGSTGMSLTNGQRKIYVGSAPANGLITELPEPFHGILIQDSSGITHKISSFNKK